jgi:four helix bundle protein
MGDPIRDFRDLAAWQNAIELAVVCGDVADALPAYEFRLAEQLRGAANGVHACISEGNGRPTLTDYLKYLRQASSSLNEVFSHLTFIRRRYPRVAATPAAIEWVDKTARPLRGLIRSLRDKQARERLVPTPRRKRKKG